MGKSLMYYQLKCLCKDGQEIERSWMGHGLKEALTELLRVYTDCVYCMVMRFDYDISSSIHADLPTSVIFFSINGRDKIYYSFNDDVEQWDRDTFADRSTLTELVNEFIDEYRGKYDEDYDYGD